MLGFRAQIKLYLADDFLLKSCILPFQILRIVDGIAHLRQRWDTREAHVQPRLWEKPERIVRETLKELEYPRTNERLTLYLYYIAPLNE